MEVCIDWHLHWCQQGGLAVARLLLSCSVLTPVNMPHNRHPNILNQWWPSLLTRIYVTRAQWLNRITTKGIHGHIPWNKLYIVSMHWLTFTPMDDILRCMVWYNTTFLRTDVTLYEEYIIQVIRPRVCLIGVSIEYELIYKKKNVLNHTCNWKF